MTVKLLLLLLVLLGLSWAWKHPCPIFAESCDECIQSGPECGWCTKFPYGHCDTLEYLYRTGCRDSDVYNPQSSLEVLQNHSSSHTEDSSSLFLQPQLVSLHLRPAVSQSFTLTVSMPTDQPITELTLETSEVPAGVNITFSSVQQGNPLMIQVNVEAVQCPNTSDSVNQNQTGPWFVQITPKGFKVSLKLEITLQCQCSCSQHRQEKSPDCRGIGSLVCGRCYCEKNFTGTRCQILSDEFLTPDERRCRRDETEALCSGRGTCVKGGTCECNKRPNPAERYSGAFCECSNFDCPYHNNSGPANPASAPPTLLPVWQKTSKCATDEGSVSVEHVDARIRSFRGRHARNVLSARAGVRSSTAVWSVERLDWDPAGVPVNVDDTT